MIEPHDHYIFYEREAERDRLEQAGEDCRDDIPDNDAAWVARVVPCKLCNKPTAGSTGAAGIFWPDLCQPCKNGLDNSTQASIKHLLNLIKSK